MFSAFKKKLSHWYLLFELNTAIHMLEPQEKFLVNLLFFTILGLITYSSYVYLPHYTITILTFFGVLQPEIKEPLHEPLPHTNTN